jgi:hypothetical protein
MYGEHMKDQGLNDKEIDRVSSILGSQMDTRINELFEETYKD